MATPKKCKNCGDNFFWSPDKNGRYHVSLWRQKEFCSRICVGRYAVKSGRLLTEEVRRKQSQAKLLVPSGHFDPSKETSIERSVRELLDLLGIEYQRQVPLCGVGWADFLIPDKKIVIECDGDYWHSLERVKIRDSKKESAWVKSGYKVIRLKEYEIRNDLWSVFNSRVLIELK